jgi:hypothetical protein
MAIRKWRNNGGGNGEKWHQWRRRRRNIEMAIGVSQRRGSISGNRVMAKIIEGVCVMRWAISSMAKIMKISGMAWRKRKCENIGGMTAAIEESVEMASAAAGGEMKINIMRQRKGGSNGGIISNENVCGIINGMAASAAAKIMA